MLTIGPPPRLFTAADAARLSGWSYGLVRDLAKTGAAPIAAIIGQHAPLFDEAGIAWLKERRRKRGAVPA